MPTPFRSQVASILLALAVATSLSLLVGPRGEPQATYTAGDEVVARWRDMFVTATVVEAPGDKVKVSIVTGPYPAEEGGEPPREEVLLPATDVVAMPDFAAAPATKPGELVLAQYDHAWLPRRLEEWTEESTLVVNFGGQEESCLVLDLPETWRAEAQTRWDRGQDLTGIQETTASKIPRTLGAAVKPGDAVLYAWTLEGDKHTCFSEGLVKEFSGGKVRMVTVGADGPQDEEITVDAALVCPAPPANQSIGWKSGDIVLYRFTFFAHHVPWVPARVEALCGSLATVTLSGGETRTAESGTIVPLKDR